MFSLVDAFSQIIANEGVGTLWNGTLPSLILVLNPAVQFMFYEAMKRKAGKGGRKVRKEREIHSLEIYYIHTYSYIHMYIFIYIYSFYLSNFNLSNSHSVIWQPLKTLAICGLNHYVYPQISSAEIFLIGAIAKAIATTATYPLQTVQAILRVNFHTSVYSPPGLSHCLRMRHVIFHTFLTVNQSYRKPKYNKSDFLYNLNLTPLIHLC